MNIIKNTKRLFSSAFPGNGTSAVLGYKNYTALIQQAGIATPTASILSNTLGETVTISRSGVGVYLLTITGGQFTTGKLFIPGFTNSDGTGIQIIHQVISAGVPTGNISIIRIDNNNVAFGCSDPVGVAIELSTLLAGTTFPLEIRVYP